MKAVTPVIALVMLLLITVGIVGASYTWFGGLMSSQTKKSITIPPGGAYCADGDIKVYVLNNGDAAITASDITVAQVDGVDVKGTPFFGDMRSNLVGYWKFDEAGGTTARDSSGNDNNGDLKPACPNCPEWKTGRSRNALVFDGVDDYVDAGSGSSLTSIGTGDFSAGAWVKTSSGSGDYAILGYINSNPQWTLFIRDGNVYGFIKNSAGAQNEVTSVSIADGLWHYTVFVLSRTTSTLKIYIDGVEKGSNTLTVSNSVTNSGLYIGQYSNDRYWSGTIDEVKIYNKAAGDVSVQPSSSGLVVNYPGAEGKHTVRVGTSSNIAEATVSCA